MDNVRFATIGTSMITGRFLDALATCADASYIGSFSRDVDKSKAYTAAHGGSTPFSSLEMICADPEVDAVYVASPNAMHYPQVAKIAAAGKHVLVEKPLASNHDEAETLLAVAHDAGVVAMEAMRTLHNPMFKLVKESLSKIAPVRSANLRYGKRSSRYDDVLAGRHTNIFDAQFATGALMDLGVYCVEPMVELFGIPNDIRCFSNKLGRDIDFTGAILADYDQLVCELGYSKITQDLLPSQIMGEAGTLLVDAISGPGEAHIVYLDGTREDLDISPIDNDMAFEIEDFIGAIRGSFDLTHLHKVSLASLAIMDEARYQCGITFPADQNN